MAELERIQCVYSLTASEHQINKKQAKYYPLGKLLSDFFHLCYRKSLKLTSLSRKNPASVLLLYKLLHVVVGKILYKLYTLTCCEHYKRIVFRVFELYNKANIILCWKQIPFLGMV